MQYVAFDPDIEILGAAVMATFGGFGPFRAIVERVLTRAGLADNDGSGRGRIDVDRWYVQQAWLDALREVDERYGTEVLFSIGAEIPNSAVFPSTAVDVHSAVRSIDVAYHLNHRRRGVVLYDPASGVMLEGIGHYGYQHIGDNEILAVCHTPYPCEFDLGIITTMARRFQPRTLVEHVGDGCRRHGAESCSYLLHWT